VRARDGVTIVDEIYLGLSYDDTYGHSALALGEHIVSVNSFSKYFNMTGWRRSSAWRRTSTSAPPPSLSTRRWPASSPHRSPSTSAAGPNSGAGAMPS